MKRLTLIRHAKAAWNADEDSRRTLHERGEQDAPEMGRRMHNAGLYPDCICSSSATRAMQTTSLVITSLGFSADKIIKDESIYNAEPETLLRIASRQADSCQHLMMVGHNPGMTDFCNRLGEDFHIDDLPTCAVISFDFDIEHWSAMAEKSGHLVFFDFPANTKPIINV